MTVSHKTIQSRAFLPIQQLFIQYNIYHKKTKKRPTFPPQWCRHVSWYVCCQWMSAFITEFWTLKPLWDSFLHFYISLASVTTKMVLQSTKKTKVNWSQVRAVWWMFKALPSILLQYTAICQIVWSHCFVFSWEMQFWIKSSWVSKYYVFLLSRRLHILLHTQQFKLSHKLTYK